MDLNVRTKTFSQGNHKWLRSDYGENTCFTATLVVSTFTAGTHYPNGYLPAGLALGKLTAGGYGPYDNTAVDGRQTMVGHLRNDEPIDPTSPPTHVVVAIQWQADVDESKLPANHGVDTAGKADVAGWIRYS